MNHRFRLLPLALFLALFIAHFSTAHPPPFSSFSALLIFSRNLFFGPALHPRVFRELVSLIGGKEDSRSCEIVSSRLRVLLRTFPVLLSSPLSASCCGYPLLPPTSFAVLWLDPLDRNMLAKSHTQLPVPFPVATSASFYYPPVSQISWEHDASAPPQQKFATCCTTLPLFPDPPQWPHIDASID